MLVQLRDICGVRSGDKLNISDLSLFAPDAEVFELIREHVTAERVKAHFGDFVCGEVFRYDAPNVLALKFVMLDALGGGAARSLRSDTQGKTMGLSLLRMTIDVPEDVAVRLPRRDRPPSPR